MRVFLCFAIAALFSAALSPPARAGLLDQYQCVQYLKDIENLSDGEASHRSLVLVAWAAGYAAAHEKETLRVDDSALQLIAGVLADECRKSPDQIATRAAALSIDRFVSSPSPAGATSPQPAKPSAPSPNVKAVSGTEEFLSVENRDLLGNDLRRLERVDLKVCTAACKGDALCKAYSYDRWNRWCFLKTGLAPLSLDPGSIAGIRAELGPPAMSDATVRFDVRANKKLLSSPYRTTPASSREDCESECTKEAKCLGATFTKAQKACQLFEAIENIAPDKGAVSAVKTQDPQ
jgi:hypothetical protein